MQKGKKEQKTKTKTKQLNNNDTRAQTPTNHIRSILVSHDAK